MLEFNCTETLAMRPEQIASQILDVRQWTDFQGYGPLPGIAEATFEQRTEQVVGSRIRVKNQDGSSHVEEITSWELPHRLELRLGEFSKPLSLLATGIEEWWTFEQSSEHTKVVRGMRLHPRSLWTVPVLWLIRALLKRAIAAHLQAIKRSAQS